MIILLRDRQARYTDRACFRFSEMMCRQICEFDEPVINLTSGYVMRALDTLPRQGAEKPWRTYQNYLRDLMNLRFSSIKDGTMTFSRAGQPVLQEEEAQAGRAS